MRIVELCLCFVGALLIGMVLRDFHWEGLREQERQAAQIAAPLAPPTPSPFHAPGFIFVHQQSGGGFHIAIQKIVTFSKAADGTRLDLMDGSVVMIGEGVEVIVLMLQNAEKKP